MLKDLLEILKFHGLFKGLLRFYNEYWENIYFDKKFDVFTRKIKLESEYNNRSFIKNEHKWYQPTYFTPLKKISIYLNKIIDKNCLIIDLGTGYGKPLVILNYYIKKKKKLIGIELDKSYEEIFNSNIKKFTNNFKFLNILVEDIDLNFFKENLDDDFDIIIHNKNSFSRQITKKNLDLLNTLSEQRKDINIFYIYSNPEYQELFQHKKMIFQTRGWHKNFDINLYKI